MAPAGSASLRGHWFSHCARKDCSGSGSSGSSISPARARSSALPTSRRRRVVQCGDACRHGAGVVHVRALGRRPLDQQVRVRAPPGRSSATCRASSISRVALRWAVETSTSCGCSRSAIVGVRPSSTAAGPHLPRLVDDGQGDAVAVDGLLGPQHPAGAVGEQLDLLLAVDLAHLVAAVVAALRPHPRRPLDLLADGEVLAGVKDVLRLPEPLALMHPPQAQLAQQPRLADLPGGAQGRGLPDEPAVAVDLQQPGGDEPLPPAQGAALPRLRPGRELGTEGARGPRVRDGHQPGPHAVGRRVDELGQPRRPASAGRRRRGPSAPARRPGRRGPRWGARCRSRPSGRPASCTPSTTGAGGSSPCRAGGRASPAAGSGPASRPAAGGSGCTERAAPRADRRACACTRRCREWRAKGASAGISTGLGGKSTR